MPGTDPVRYPAELTGSIDDSASFAACTSLSRSSGKYARVSSLCDGSVLTIGDVCVCVHEMITEPKGSPAAEATSFRRTSQYLCFMRQRSAASSTAEVGPLLSATAFTSMSSRTPSQRRSM